MLDTQLVLKCLIYRSIKERVITFFCEFSNLPKSGNYIITWLGVKIFNQKLELVGGENFGWAVSGIQEGEGATV